MKLGALLTQQTTGVERIQVHLVDTRNCTLCLRLNTSRMKSSKAMPLTTNDLDNYMPRWKDTSRSELPTAAELYVYLTSLNSRFLRQPRQSSSQMSHLLRAK